jgi:hypothetical protein
MLLLSGLACLIKTRPALPYYYYVLLELLLIMMMRMMIVAWTKLAYFSKTLGTVAAADDDEIVLG